MKSTCLLGISLILIILSFSGCPNGGGATSSAPPASPTPPSSTFSYYIYVTNWNNSGTVSAFTIDATSGALTQITGSPFAAGTGPTSITIAKVSH